MSLTCCLSSLCFFRVLYSFTVLFVFFTYFLKPGTTVIGLLLLWYSCLIKQLFFFVFSACILILLSFIFFLSLSLFFYHIMRKANKIKYNIIMSLVKFRLLVMSLTIQNSFSTALSMGSYLFCLKMSQSHNFT